MDLVRARKQLEIKKVRMAAEEMEFKILERQADIERLKKDIEIQLNRADELEKELNHGGE